VKKADRQYRLLSETEWEYACRAGNAGAFCYGDSIDYFPNFAASVKTKDRIATKMPNAFGLFDVHGNVWEICATPYYKRYDDLLKEASLLEDPRVEPGSKLAKRGGAAYNAPTACRSALREIIMADEGLTKTGFRVVLEIKPVSAP